MPTKSAPAKSAPVKSAPVKDDVPSVRISHALLNEIVAAVMRAVPIKHTIEAADKVRDDLIRAFAAKVLAPDAFAIWTDPERRHLLSHNPTYGSSCHVFHTPPYDPSSVVIEAEHDRLLRDLRSAIDDAYDPSTTEAHHRSEMRRALRDSLRPYTTTRKLVEANPDLRGAVLKVLHTHGKIITPRTGALTTDDTRRALLALAKAGLKLPT